MPFQLAGVRVQRHYRFAVQIVAGANVAVIVGTGVSSSPVGQVELGVIRAGHPNGSASRLPGVASPGFLVRVARSGNGVEAPRFLPRADLVAVNERAHSDIA